MVKKKTTTADYKYNVGDTVVLRIGERAPLHVVVLERVMRRGPQYKLDWAKGGYHELLNTIFVPERSLHAPQTVENCSGL
jgi:hypothetical protein